MSATMRPVWLEGMFVRPQHFQQWDRWIEAEIQRRTVGLRAYGWGLSRLELDASLLPLGRIGVVALEAVMPDGSTVSIPEEVAPEPRAVPAGLRDRAIKIAVPVRRHERGDFVLAGDRDDAKRFRVDRRSARDATRPERDGVEIQVARPQVAILFDGEPEDDRVVLPIAFLQEVTPAGEVRLSQTYAPPVVDLAASRALTAVTREVQRLVRARAEAIASRLDPSRMAADAAGFLDLMTLAAINGKEALLGHFLNTAGQHPEIVYRALVELAGTLGTFDARRRRAPDCPPYRHNDLEGSFQGVLQILRELLSVIFEEQAVAIPLQKRAQGVWVGVVADRALFDRARFVLVATASVSPETVRGQLPAQTKIGPVETIRELVNLQLPGIGMKALPVAPREIPFVRNSVYFELDQTGDLWRRLAGSAAFAVHSSGAYPDLEFTLWAVRSE